MGKTQSKSVENTGDAQITVIQQTQEAHSEDHQQHEILLWIVLAMVAIQLIIKLYEVYKKHERKLALKAARSVAAIAEV